MTFRSLRSPQVLAGTALAVIVGLFAPLASLPTASAAEPATPAQAEGVVSRATVGGLQVENSFVSSVGWVKPGETYPSRMLLTNTVDRAKRASVTLTAPVGTTFTDANNGATDRRQRPDGQLDRHRPGHEHHRARARECRRDHRAAADHRVA